MERKNRNFDNFFRTMNELTAEGIYEAAIYVQRTVKNKRSADINSVEDEIQMLRDFAAKKSEIHVFDIYCDDKLADTTVARHEFARMMKDIGDGHINCIIVKNVQSIGRNADEREKYLEEIFPFSGTRFIAMDNKIDTIGEPTGLSSQIKRLYAQEVSERVRNGMRYLQEQGKFLGGQPPYGYKHNSDDKYSLVVAPETAPIVQSLFQKALDGHSVEEIALQMNKQGIPSPGRYNYEKGLTKSKKYKSAVWLPATIRKILSNPVYLGWVQYGKYESRPNKYVNKRVKVPEKNWITIKETHEPIIEEAVFKRVQEMLNKKQE